MLKFITSTATIIISLTGAAYSQTAQLASLEAFNNHKIAHKELTVAQAGLSGFVFPGQDQNIKIVVRVSEFHRKHVVDLYGDFVINIMVPDGFINGKANNDNLTFIGNAEISTTEATIAIDNIINAPKVLNAKNVRFNGGDIILE